MYKQFFNVNTRNAIKIFNAGLKVTWAVPEKHIINFFWPWVPSTLSAHPHGGLNTGHLLLVLLQHLIFRTSTESVLHHLWLLTSGPVLALIGGGGRRTRPGWGSLSFYYLGTYFCKKNTSLTILYILNHDSCNKYYHYNFKLYVFQLNTLRTSI